MARLETPRILLLGLGHCGKGVVCDYLAEAYHLKPCSSSQFCTPYVRENMNKYIDDGGLVTYDSDEECYADRRDYREAWLKSIQEYTAKDKSRLAKEILKEYDVYDGMRDRDEFLASKDLFDFVIYISRPDQKPDSTFLIDENDFGELKRYYHVENTGTIEELHAEIDKIMSAEDYEKSALLFVEYPLVKNLINGDPVSLFSINKNSPYEGQVYIFCKRVKGIIGTAQVMIRKADGGGYYTDIKDFEQLKHTVPYKFLNKFLEGEMDMEGEVFGIKASKLTPIPNLKVLVENYSPPKPNRE